MPRNAPDQTVELSTTLLVTCPHGCVNKLRVVVMTDASTGHVTDIRFDGHEHTHDEWTGRPLQPPHVTRPSSSTRICDV